MLAFDYESSTTTYKGFEVLPTVASAKTWLGFWRQKPFFSQASKWPVPYTFSRLSAGARFKPARDMPFWITGLALLIRQISSDR